MDTARHGIRRYDLGVLALLAGLAVAAFIFRGALDLLVVPGLVIATLIQLLRVLFFHGNRRRLKLLWEALRDAIPGL